MLAGAFSAHFTPDISAVPKDERMEIGEARSLARNALGEAAYGAALARGAATDDDEVVGYAQGEYRRLASLLAEPGAPAPESPPGPGAADPPGMTVLLGKATCCSTARAASTTVIPASPRGGDRPARQPGRPMSPWQRLMPPASTGAPKCSLKLPALPAAYDRHARPERADLREATRTDGAGISRAESAGSGVPGSGSAARSSRLVIAVEWPGITGRFRRPLIAMRTACPVTPLGGGPGQGAG